MTFQTTDAEVALGLTRQFIDENKSDIVIGRRDKVATASGGFKLAAPIDQPAQEMRLVPGRMYADTIRTTSDGRQVRPTFTLVALPDANVERYDVFKLGGDDYEIVWVTYRPLFQRKVAEVWQHG